MTDRSHRLPRGSGPHVTVGLRVGGWELKRRIQSFQDFKLIWTRRSANKMAHRQVVTRKLGFLMSLLNCPTSYNSIYGYAKADAASHSVPVLILCLGISVYQYKCYSLINKVQTRKPLPSCGGVLCA
uniref:Uncharacterized protein n=1 Tax=Oryza glumipatula TaxID=40148 RepID=A0A0E0BVD9_9ORYZ